MAPTNKYSSDIPRDGVPRGTSDANQMGFSMLSAGEKLSAGTLNAQPATPAIPPKRRKPIERKFNVSELIKIMYRGRWIILTTFVLAFAYSVYSTYSKPYIYGSAARMFNRNRPAGRRS